MRVLLGACLTALVAGSGHAQTSAPAASPATAQEPTADIPDPGFDTDSVGDVAPGGRDRFENINRAIWGFNQTVDRVVLKPSSSVYRTVTPKPARRGIARIFANLSEPWSFVNNLLQGKPGRALNNLGRFVINTTIGVGGLADHATNLGLRATPEDLGQTLAVWGVRHSAYVVLPVLGPSTVRDGIGTGVAFVADPYRICLNECTNLSVWTKRGITALTVVSTRAEFSESGADAFLESSLDPYAAARSAFLQRRDADILDQGDDDPVADAATPSLDPTAADVPPPNEPLPDEAAPPPATPQPDAAPAPADSTPTDDAGNPLRLP